jgi:hypothetical protein
MAVGLHVTFLSASGGRRSPSPFTPRPRRPTLRSGKQEAVKGPPVRTITDDPSGAPGSVPALRRPRLRAPARAPDWVGFADGPHALWESGGGAVLCRHIQRRHRPAAAAPVRALVVWPRGRPSCARRSAAPLWTGSEQMSPRAPASVSRDAPCGASVTIPGHLARRVTALERLTCGRLCIRFTFPIRCGECLSDLEPNALALAPSQ